MKAALSLIPGSFKFRWILIPTLLATLAAAPYFGQLWLKQEQQRLSRDQKELEVKLRELQKANDQRRQKYAALITPEELDKQVRSLGLGLVPPQPDTIKRLYEVVDLNDPSAARYYADAPPRRPAMLAASGARE